jgi:outer membrane protein assembly factor BamB
MKISRLLVILLLCGSAMAQDAWMFRGNPQHTGVYETQPLTKFNQVQWKFQAGGQIASSPAVVKDTVYFGSLDNNLYAINRSTGTLKWKFETKSRVASSPAVADGVVYFGSFDGSFYAVDAITGKQNWKFDASGERRFTGKHLHGALPVAESMPDPWDCYLSSPVVWEGAVYFGSGDGNVYALDAKSGALKWKFQTGDVVHASPAIADGKLFVGSWDSYFYAIDAKSGKEVWRFKTGEDPEIHNQVGIQSSAAVADGVVYFGCRDSNLYAVDAKTGQKKWAFNNKGSWVIGSPAVRDGKIYFSTSDSGLLYVLDAKTGTGPTLLSSNKWPMFSSPALVGNMLYIGSDEGKLFAVDLTNQKEAWMFQTEGSKQIGPKYTKPDGTPNYDAAFTSFFYDDMMVGYSRLMSVGAIRSSVVVADGVVYIGSMDGNLYALQ